MLNRISPLRYKYTNQGYKRVHRYSFLLSHLFFSLSETTGFDENQGENCQFLNS
jgi:hypothetical protein